jgi:hypothetical protein
LAISAVGGIPNKQQPAATSMGMATAWLLHGHAAWAWLLHGHAAASKPGCMVHGMSLQQQQLLRACMRACVAAFVIDTIYELTRRRRPMRGESNFRIDIFAKVRGGQYGNSILHACPKCTFASGWPNMPVLIHTSIRNRKLASK